MSSQSKKIRRSNAFKLISLDNETEESWITDPHVLIDDVLAKLQAILLQL